jgi:hypothetical protein
MIGAGTQLAHFNQAQPVQALECTTSRALALCAVQCAQWMLAGATRRFAWRSECTP